MPRKIRAAAGGTPLAFSGEAGAKFGREWEQQKIFAPRFLSKSKKSKHSLGAATALLAS
jgi:hypothetical protein